MRDDERLNLLSSTCSGVAVSSDHKYHTPAVLQVLVTKTEKVSKAMFARLRPDRSNQGGKLTLQQVPHEITNSFQAGICCYSFCIVGHVVLLANGQSMV